MIRELAWALGFPSLVVGISKWNMIRLKMRSRKRARLFKGILSENKIPILFVPGILGTTLVDPLHNDFPVWGSYRGSFFYHHKYEDIDLPIKGGRKNRLKPGRILWRFPIIPGLFSIPVFEEFKSSLISSGYTTCSLDTPTSVSGLYDLLYDWRYDIVEGALALEMAVDNLKNSLGVNKVHLIGHSWGSVVIRYYLRYGGADVLSYPAVDTRPGNDNIDTFFAVGAPYGGSLRGYHEIARGFSPGGPFGRPVYPHHVASCPVSYQLLRLDPKLILDEKGEPSGHDITKVETWEKFELGPFSHDSFKILLKRAMIDSPAITENNMKDELRLFLHKNISRAASLSRIISAPHPHDEKVRTVTYASNCRPTLTNLVLLKKGKGSHLITTENDLMRYLPGPAKYFMAPGDEYVTFDSIKESLPGQKVVTDPYDAPDGSYINLIESENHREIFKTDHVLTNILLNLTRE